MFSLVCVTFVSFTRYIASYTMHHITWVCLSVAGFNSVGTCFGVGILVMSNYLWLERARIAHFASLLWLHVYARLPLEPQSKCSIPLRCLAILPLAIVHANGEVIRRLHCCYCGINTHIRTDCLYLRSCPSMLVLVIPIVSLVIALHDAAAITRRC